jgi:hypothetical protein
VQNGTLKTYPGFPHGMLTTHADTLNPDLLASSNPDRARSGIPASNFTASSRR